MPHVIPRERRTPTAAASAEAGSLKLVYWGPGRSGKTTNLRWLHSRLRPELKGRLITLDSPGERTLYFDCLPLDLSNEGKSLRLRLYTVPGQPRFHLTRNLVLHGVDGIVFVWDSRPRRLRENVASLLELRESLASLGHSRAGIPLVAEFNKQDLAERMPTEKLQEILHQFGEDGPAFPSSALLGQGVLECLSSVTCAAIRRSRRVG